MKPDQKCPVTAVSPVDPALQDAGHARRNGRLCYRLGLTAALVAGAGSIALGADPAQAAPAAVASAARPGLDGAHGATPIGGPAAAGDLSSTDGSSHRSQDAVGEWRYTSHRETLSNRTGSTLNRTGSAPEQHRAGRRSAGPVRQNSGTATASHGSVETAVKFALAQLGKPFALGATGPNAYDCSGLIQRSFRNAGISLPRVANDQYAATTPVSAGQLRRGDLLFWSNDGSARRIHHGAIYLGNGSFVEAPRAGANVRIRKLTRAYWPTQMSRP